MESTSCRRGHRLQALSRRDETITPSDGSPENPWGLSPRGVSEMLSVPAPLPQSQLRACCRQREMVALSRIQMLPHTSSPHLDNQLRMIVVRFHSLTIDN